MQPASNQCNWSPMGKLMSNYGRPGADTMMMNIKKLFVLVLYITMLTGSLDKLWIYNLKS